MDINLLNYLNKEALKNLKKLILKNLSQII